MSVEPENKNENGEGASEENKPRKILRVSKKTSDETQKPSAKKKVVVKKKKKKKIVIKKEKAKSENTEQGEGKSKEKETHNKQSVNKVRHSKPGESKKPYQNPGKKPAPKGSGSSAPASNAESKEEKKSGHSHSKGKKDYSKAKKDNKDKEREQQANKALDRLARRKRQQQMQEQQKKERLSNVTKSIEIMDNISVGELAKKMNLKASDIISKLMEMGTMARVNDVIDSDTATIIADEFGVKTKVISLEEEATVEVAEDKEEDLSPRAPVVTIMGHVDHGKTQLLDTIRKTDVVSKESGRITQHIGAYKVNNEHGEIAFIDTPGHAAFTMMRSRGANVTDLVVLVVAADDGVMPQTIEAINHAKAAKVPIIVAVNKIDKPDKNTDKILSQLSEQGLIPEEWGGDTLFDYVSALTGEGVEKLLDDILLQSEMLELKANPKREAIGTVLESSLDIGRGAVGTVLVQNGSLNVGDYFIAGVNTGKVRALFDDKRQRLKTAGPSTPVEVLGFDAAPEAGELFHVMDEKEAKGYADKRKHIKQLDSAQSTVKVTLDNLFEQIKEGEIEEFKVIIKADVQGSVEALKESLGKLSNDKLRFVAIHGAPGPINETDVTLADTSNAVIIAYRVRAGAKVRELAENLNVDIRQYDIIYEAIEDIEDSMKGMLKGEKVEENTASVEVRDTFKISKVGTIAGCYVTDGKIERTNLVRLVRDGVLVYSGKIASLKRFKEDAKEVAKGYECGLMIEGYNDIKVGDVIEAYTIREKAPEL